MKITSKTIDGIVHLEIGLWYTINDEKEDFNNTSILLKRQLTTVLKNNNFSSFIVDIKMRTTGLKKNNESYFTITLSISEQQFNKELLVTLIQQILSQNTSLSFIF